MIPTSPPAPLLPSIARLDANPRERIPVPPPVDGAEALYGPPTNGQRISLHLNPPIKAGLVALGNSLMTEGLLEPALRQMIIVRIGYLSGSAYEVYQHRSLAARFGVSEQKLDALACIDPPGLSFEETAMIAFVDEVEKNVRPSDAALEAVLEIYSQSQVLEAVMVCGMWMLLARMLETAGVPLDDRTIASGFRGQA